MKFNTKGMVIALMATLGLGSLFAVSPTYAHHHYHYYHHHDGGRLAAGMIFGAALGMVAGAAISNSDNGGGYH